MNTINICPQRIYEFQADESLTELARSLVPFHEWKVNKNNYITITKSLHKKKEYKLITDWFEECIETVRSEHEYECEKLSITQMWANKAPYKSWHQTHRHNYSVVSGVFYVTNSNARTWFSIPSIWEQLKVHPAYETMPVTRYSSTDPISKITSEKGKLIIFPSLLRHSVDEHLDKECERYTISFNTFPSGEVGNFSAASGLNIKLL